MGEIKTELLNDEVKKDIEREGVLKSLINIHSRNVEAYEFLRDKELVIVNHDSKIFKKLVKGEYFNKKDRAPLYIKGEKVSSVLDLLIKPDAESVKRFQDEYDKLKRKYLTPNKAE